MSGDCQNLPAGGKLPGQNCLEQPFEILKFEIYQQAKQKVTTPTPATYSLDQAILRSYKHYLNLAHRCESIMKHKQASQPSVILSWAPRSLAFVSIGLLLGLLMLSNNAIAAVWLLDKQTQLRADHPQQYRVKAGDSLWDVIGVFVENPNKINPSVWHESTLYPGNLVSLTEHGGHPALQVQRGNRVVKLSPDIITSRDERAIPKIPLSSIRQFLTHPEIVEAEELSQAPYIVANANDKLLISSGDTIYARGLDGSEQVGEAYMLLRPGEAYTDIDEEGNEDEQEPLAFGALYLGEAQLESFNEDEEANLATFKVLFAKQEIRTGDRLMAVPMRDFEEDFIPSLPNEVEGMKIIGVTDNTTYIGQFQVVVLNRGEQDGIQRGNVLAVYHSGMLAQDPVNGETLKLPSIKSGSLLVFKVYDRVSFALINRATQPIYVNDSVELN